MSQNDRIAAALVEGAKRYIDRQLAGFTARLAALEARAPVPGKDGIGVVGALRDADGCLVLTFTDGKTVNVGQVDGKNGRDVTADEIRGVLVAEIAKLPAPKDGQDAEVAEVAERLKDDVVRECRRQVDEALAAADLSNRGKGAATDEIGQLITAEVEKALAARPAPRDGKDADPETTAAMVAEQVAAAVGKIPVPKDGTSVSIDDVRPVIAEAVAELPKPQDGKSVDPAEVKTMVAAAVGEAVAALPKPKDGDDGKSVTVDEVAPLIAAEVAKATAEIPSAQKIADMVGHSVSVAVASIREPEDGKSVTLDDVRPLVAEAVAALPKPENGKDVDMDQVRDQIARALGIISGTHESRVVALEDALRANVRAAIDAAINGIRVPEDGKSVTTDDIAPLITTAVKEQLAIALENMPKPQDGKSVTLEDVAPVIEGAVKRAVDALPPAKDGRDFDPEVLRAAVVEEVSAAVAKIPTPKDGASVTVADVTPVLEELVSKAVAGIRVPKDGIGLAGAVIDREGELAITMTDGTIRALGRVAGKDVDMAEVARLIAAEIAKIPVPKDGRDGFSLEHFSASLADHRGLVLRFQQGETVKEFRIDLPVMIYRGVFKEGEQYEVGDFVTWAGAGWHCNVPTTEKPGDGSKTWTLAVKKGRDGKDGRDLAPRPPATAVPLKS